MARTPANLKNTTQLSVSATDVVDAVTQNTQTVIRTASFMNTGTSVRTITVYVVASGGSAGTTNILTTKTIAAGRSWNCIELQGVVLTGGMKAQAAVDAGTDVNVNISGTTVV